MGWTAFTSGTARTSWPDRRCQAVAERAGGASWPQFANCPAARTASAVRRSARTSPRDGGDPGPQPDKLWEVRKLLGHDRPTTTVSYLATAHADPEAANPASSGRAGQRLVVDKGNLR